MKILILWSRLFGNLEGSIVSYNLWKNLSWNLEYEDSLGVKIYIFRSLLFFFKVIEVVWICFVN